MVTNPLAMIEPFATAGADYLSVSAGSRFEDAPVPPPNMPPDPMSGYSGQRMSPGYGFPDATHAYLAGDIRLGSGDRRRQIKGYP